MIGLTPRQRDLLAFIEACPKPPTLRQMGRALGYAESNLTDGVWRLLRGLEDKGRIRRQYNCSGVEILHPLHPVIIKGQPYRFIPMGEST